MNYKQISEINLSLKTDWTNVLNVSIEPDYAQTLYSNGYNMVRVDIWFTPTDKSGVAISTTDGDQQTLNAAVRLIDYDNGGEVYWLDTPPTPDKPLSTDAFRGFNSWAQTQTANEFLTTGMGLVAEAVSKSCVTFYVLCNATNPNPPSLKLGVQFQPSGAAQNSAPQKYWRNGNIDLGDNGYKTINATPGTVYGADDLQCILTKQDNGSSDDSTPDGAVPFNVANYYRQYNGRISFKQQGLSLVYRIDGKKGSDGYHACFSQKGYTTYSYIWAADDDRKQKAELNSSKITFDFDIRAPSTTYARYALIFQFTPDYGKLADSTETILRCYDHVGNCGEIELHTLLPDYMSLLSGADWSPLTAGDSTVIDKDPNIKLSNQAYGQLEKTTTSSSPSPIGASATAAGDAFQLYSCTDLYQNGTIVSQKTHQADLYIDTSDGTFIFAGGAPAEKLKFLPVWKQGAAAIYSTTKHQYLEASQRNVVNNYHYISPFGPAPVPRDPESQSNPSDTLWFIS